MQEYWRLHSQRWSGIDFSKDPEGLTNVLIPGEALWLNRHFARMHKMVYANLFAMIPGPNPGARALDMGCGAGRWTRFLADHGYKATGIDLQPELIDGNRKRHPDLEFFNIAIQDFNPAERFDLISSVTVIQHTPYDQHDRIITKIRELLKPGGYALILENISEQLPHIFPHPLEEWKEKFAKVGFQCLADKKFNYDLFLKWHSRVQKAAFSFLKPSSADTEPIKENDLTPQKFLDLTTPALRPAKGNRILHSLNLAAKRMAVAMDSLVEPILIQTNSKLGAAHCGFLFKVITRSA